MHHEKFDENDHDYNKNVSDLGHSLSQTSIKDEPKQKSQNDRSVMDQSSYTTSHTIPSSVSSQSALVQLLTTNRQLNSARAEDHHNGAGFAECDVNHGRFFKPIDNSVGRGGCSCSDHFIYSSY